MDSRAGLTTSFSTVQYNQLLWSRSVFSPSSDSRRSEGVEWAFDKIDCVTRSTDGLETRPIAG